MPKRTTPTRRQAAIAALVGGASYGDAAAAAAGGSPRTLYSWRQESDFHQELFTQQGLIREVLADRLVDTALAAIHVLATLQHAAELDSVRVQAATTILRHAAQVWAAHDFNRALTTIRRYGLVAIPEDRLNALKMTASLSYDEPTELPWETDETEGI